MLPDLLLMYRERNGSPAFWAEPLNALSNVAFLIAASLAWRLAVRRGAMTRMTAILVTLAFAIGLGSFAFHTAAGPMTYVIDVGPIALLMLLFLWLASREMLGWPLFAAAAFVVVVLATAFALMPLRQPGNGSLFYLPALLGMVILGGLRSMRGGEGSHLLLVAGMVFLLALTARTVDWSVPWSTGTHFVWHLLNGVVVYLGLRAWILHVAGTRSS